MNKKDKERLLSIVKQIEKYVDDLEGIQNREYIKYDSLSDDAKNSVIGQTLDNNLWLLQPFHDTLEEALSKFEVIQDLIDPSEKDYDMACMMASYHKKNFYAELERKQTHNKHIQNK